MTTLASLICTVPVRCATATFFKSQRSVAARQISCAAQLAHPP
jgi:hypothetical protein